MTPFPDKFQAEDAGMRRGTRVFALLARFRYLSSLGEVVVPRGFETDGASVPRMFWALFDPISSDFFPAAVIHDFLYSKFNDEYTREEADFIFLEAMFNLGVPWYRRHVIHAAVRAFGWSAFKGTAP